MCLLFVAVGPGMDAVGIWIFKILIDDVLTPRDFSLFPLVAAAYVGIAVVGGLLSFVDDYLCTWVGERFVLNLRTDLFAHLHRMSLGFFERRQLGDLMSRLSSDVNAIEQLVLSGVMQVVAHGVKILIFGGLLFYLNWKLTLASLIAAPLFALASRYFSTRIKAASREKRRRTGTISAVAEESLSNAALVQAYDRQVAETKRFHTENLGAFAAQMMATRLRATFGPFIDLLETAAVLLVVGIGIWQLAVGRDDPRRPAGVHGLPGPALRADPGVRRPGQHRVRRQRRRRADHRGPRREAVGDRPGDPAPVRPRARRR